MAQFVDKSLTASNSQIIGGGQKKSTQDQVLKYYKDYKSEMARLLLQIGDDNVEEVEIMGVKTKKNGLSFTYLWQEWMSQTEAQFGQMLSSLKFEQTLENKLNNMLKFT